MNSKIIIVKLLQMNWRKIIIFGMFLGCCGFVLKVFLVGLGKNDFSV